MERYGYIYDRPPDEPFARPVGMTEQADGTWVKYADAQATVEALQKDNRTYINERHENMKQLEELRQQVEALQRELQTERERSLKQAQEAMVVLVRAQLAEQELSQLQALVREVVNAGVAFEDMRIPYKEVQIDRDWFDRARATLDATTPAEVHDRMFNHADRHKEAL